MIDNSVCIIMEVWIKIQMWVGICVLGNVSLLPKTLNRSSCMQLAGYTSWIEDKPSLMPCNRCCSQGQMQPSLNSSLQNCMSENYVLPTKIWWRITWND